MPPPSTSERDHRPSIRITDILATDSVAKSSPTQPKAQPAATSQAEEVKTETQTTQPLAPPPKPSNPAETPDYFSGLHNTSTGISAEFNPFEQSFGAPSTETPGKTLLPGVAALTSPAIPGATNTPGYNWQGSLRSGPLSPAMLPGPQSNDYFDSINRGFPTPNESSLRTGLTPGGGGSMFPAPSPNSQALFSQLQSGGATPGTLDFHRTAINAAARSRNGTNNHPATSNPQEAMAPNNTVDAQHDATDAANGLFMLAKGAQANNQFAVPNQTAQQMSSRNGDRRTNGSSDMSANGDNADSPEAAGRASTRARGKKGAKGEATPNNRRKSDAPAKGANKKAKGNSGAAMVDPALDPDNEDDSDDDDMMMDTKDTKKMTDEEKRRNFLERNRYVLLCIIHFHCTDRSQCRSTQMSPTQEAVAG
jgi:ATF/CREB family transcription factor